MSAAQARRIQPKATSRALAATSSKPAPAASRASALGTAPSSRPSPARSGLRPLPAADRAGSSEAAAKTRAGRPRDPQVDAAIKQATRELLVEGGYGGVTLDAVARRAGVGRPTLYRRWKSKAELVHDAIFGNPDQHPIPDTGSLESDLRACVRTVVAMQGQPEVAAAWHGLVDDVTHSPGIRESVLPRVYRPSVLGFRRVVERAVERGEACWPIDSDVLIDIIAGAVIFRLSVSGLDLATLEDRLVELLTSALRAPRNGARQAPRRRVRREPRARAHAAGRGSRGME